MKVCPTCQTKYSDSLEYCLQDGTVLAALPDPNATLRLESRPTQTTTAKKSRGLVFALIGVAAIIVVVILVAVIGMIAYVGSPRETSSSNRAANSSWSGTTNPQPGNVEAPKEDTPATIQRINDEISAALVKNDFVTLDRLVANDYLYENDQGLKLTKQQFLIAMRAGTLRYDYVNSSDASVEVNPAMTTATLNARAQSRGQFMQQRFNDNYRYRNTYEKRSDGWQLVSGYAWYR